MRDFFKICQNLLAYMDYRIILIILAKLMKIKLSKYGIRWYLITFQIFMKLFSLDNR